MMRLLRLVVVYELKMWHSLYLWIQRRRVLPSADAKPFGYSGRVAMLFGVFIGLSAVEIPIFHLMLPWPTVRHIVDMIGAWGLVWMIGALAMLKVRPHAVADTGLHVRNGISIHITIPWQAIAAIRPRDRSLPPGGSVQIEEGPSGRILQIGVGAQTNVDVALREPTRFRLSKGDTEPVSELRFAVDDPAGLVSAARGHLMAREPSNGQ